MPTFSAKVIKIDPATTLVMDPQHIHFKRDTVLSRKNKDRAEMIEKLRRKWYVIDAAGIPLGRVAVAAANLLRGRNKALYTPHCDCGDNVVVINSEKVVLTGKKEVQKIYTSFSGYVGGHKSENVKLRRARRPELLVANAVKGMIPHTRLGRQVIKKLKVVVGAENPYASNNPIPFTNLQ